MATLSVYTKNGKFYRNTDTFGKMELYVEYRIEAGDYTQTQKTKIVNGGPN